MTDTDYKGIDKLYHFGACLILALLHPCLAVGAALGKEYGDYRSYGHWCWWDLLADTIGIALALLPWYYIWH